MHALENSESEQKFADIVGPPVDYTPAHAKRLLLQIPIAAIRINGFAALLCDIQANTTMLKSLLDKQKKQSCDNSLSKDYLKDLIALCSSDKERDCLKYAVAKASRASAKEMRTRYGIQNFNTKVKQVEEAISHVH